MATKKGLGKGMSVLLGNSKDLKKAAEKVAAEETVEVESGVKMVKIRLVEPNRDQPRKAFDEESLQELADSISVHGVIQPLIVTKRGSVYQIVAGERRWRAAKKAGLKEIPVIEKEYSDRDIAEIALIENIQRKDLNPVEEAQALKRLIDEFDITQEELSERVSKSRTVITNSLRLLKLPKGVLELLEAGDITTGHAKVLLSIPEDSKKVEAARQIVAGKLSVRETEVLAKKLAKPQDIVVKKELKNKTEYSKVEEQLKERFGTKVSIKRRSENSGKIEIEYFSLDDINRILSHIR